MLFDAHAHLNDDDLFPKAEALRGEYLENGVGYVVNAGYDIPSSQKGRILADTYPECFFTVGLHPHDSKLADQTLYENIKDLASHPKCVAVGEIGLDYHYDLSPRDVQAKVFVSQLEVAHALKKPVVIHLREAYGDFDKLIFDNKGYIQDGILLHCYSGSAEQASNVYNKLDAYYSFGGAITFAKNKGIVLSSIPKDRIMLETDCPYMTPVPFRGRENSPKYLPLVRDKMAELLSLSSAEVEKMTTENSKRFYRIK